MSDNNNSNAPGGPGLPPKWTSSAKCGIGTSLDSNSRVWFTLSHGIINEVYYPRIDNACLRDMGLIVTDGRNFVSEEKRQTESKVNYVKDGVPAFKLVNTDRENRYRIKKEVVSAPEHDVVLQRIKFIPLEGDLKDYHLYVLLSPHLGNIGSGNTGWVDNYKGNPVLYANRNSLSLALMSTAPWLKMSAGYVGSSDGWKDIMEHKQLTNTYKRAENGNIALIGEIDLVACKGEFVLSLGFGTEPTEAGNRALACIIKKFDDTMDEYTKQWAEWIRKIKPPAGPRERRNMFRISAMVIRAHEAKSFPGGLIASLSIPWGFSRGDEDLGGYHLVWPRDLVESAIGLLAAGAANDTKRILLYLQSTQEAEGHWPQNMWLDGRPYWSGIQMDETALPILLVDIAWREKVFKSDEIAYYWFMVKKAAGYIVRNGPVTQEDRWEEDPGYSPFTLAAEIAALLAAAEMADLNKEPDTAKFLRETADNWNGNIERWTYATDTELAREAGVEGYYVRIAPVEFAESTTKSNVYVELKNRTDGTSKTPATHLISPDVLAFVRFGLRAADDEKIVNTVKVIDRELRVETPFGPCWYRYNDDGYGEHEDGSPYDGTGIGRLWPLLNGERAHYELAAGRKKDAEELMHTMEAYSNPGFMIPEQVWDKADIPDKELYFGRPTGSAMPLVWAHAEYLKIQRSLKDGRIFDMPPQTVERYIKNKTESGFYIWSHNQKISTMTAGKDLRIHLLAKAKVHWSRDGWQNTSDMEAMDTHLGVFIADLPAKDMPEGGKIVFTFFWTESNKWENINYEVEIISHSQKREQDTQAKLSSSRQGA